MKKYAIALSLLVLLDLGSRFIAIPGVHAQGNVPYWFSVGPALHTACAVTASVTTYCYADDGAWVSLHGAPYAAMGGALGAVTSVFGRTGDVVAVTGDYKFAQIGAQPTFVNSFAGRVGAVVPTANDYGYSLLSGAPPMKPSFGCATYSMINSANPPFVAGGCN